MPRSPASPPYDLLLVATPSSTTAWDRATSATATAPDPSAALAALSPRPRRNARVLVASATLFTQRVRLDPARAAALAPAELESALFYEVEPFCGIPRAAAIIAIDPLTAGEWRVAVADHAELSALRDRVRAAGCRFAGAVPLPDAAPSTDPAALAAALFPAGAPPPAILRPPHGGITPRTLVLASAIATAVILALCAADWMTLSAAARRLRPALHASENAAAANAAVRREIQSATDRVRAIEEARARRAAALAALATAQTRWPALLAVLADDADGDTVLRSITSESPDDATPASARIDGLAASAPAAADAMSRLAPLLRAAGWDLHPGTVEERPGGTAAYSFTAVPLPPEDP